MVDDGEAAASACAGSSPRAKKAKQSAAAAATSLQSELYAALREAIDARDLQDLHTHLFGMGDAACWRGIMQQLAADPLTELPDVGALAWVEMYRTSALTGPFWDNIWAAHNVPVLSYHPDVLHATAPLAGEVVTAVFNELFMLERVWHPMPSGAVPISARLVEYLRAFRVRNPAASLPEYVVSRLTSDVVFDEAALAQALFDHAPVQDVGGAIRRILGASDNAAVAGLLQESYKEYIVFNAREQQFDLRLGVPNRVLVRVMQLQPSVTRVVDSAFCMVDQEGAVPPLSVLNHTMRDHFTPQFYPRRFILKDELYSQRLCVINMLLARVLVHYWQSGVGYAEPSVGIGDLLRPWVFRHLVDPTIHDDARALAPAYPADPDKHVGYAFLAGFNRTALRFYNTQTGQWTTIDKWAAIRLLENAPQLADMYSTKGPMAERSAQDMIAQVVRLQEAFEEAGAVHVTLPLRRDRATVPLVDLCNGDQMEQDDPTWKAATEASEELPDNHIATRVVGFDWMGDELGFPYIAFGLQPFIDFGNFVLFNFGRQFGYRVHAGESLPASLSSPAAYVKHVEILMETIQRLWDNEHLLPVRVGHGVALLSERLDESTTLTAVQRRARLYKRSITVEINLTSNVTLLSEHSNGARAAAAAAAPAAAPAAAAAAAPAAAPGAAGVVAEEGDVDETQEHVAKTILALHGTDAPVPDLVFGTDDEGVVCFRHCPCTPAGAERSVHSSVAAEICIAIHAQMFPSVQALRSCVVAAQQRMFGHVMLPCYENKEGVDRFNGRMEGRRGGPL